MSWRYRFRKKWHGLFFVMPGFFHVLLFVFVPISYALYVSLHAGIGRNQSYVGLSNYSYMLSNSAFWNSLKITLIFTFTFAILCIIVATLLAQVLNRKIAFRGFFRSMIFFPYMVSVVVIAQIWQFVLDQRYGLLNYVLSWIGIEPVSWLGDPRFALYSLILIQSWMLIGYNMIIILLGIQGIPKMYYESARVEGATSTQVFTHITIPLLIPTLFITGLSSTVMGFTQSFALVQILTRGGPLSTTDILPYFIYRTAFDYFDLPGANALSLMTFGIVLSVSLGLYALEEKLNPY